jgi:1,4-alpha-glucan branching enzyme
MVGQDMAPYFFHQGTNYQSFRLMGCHCTKLEDGILYTFRVWAPHAREVFVVGDFCDWKQGLPMTKVTDMGLWELEYVTSEPIEGAYYKYRILNGDREIFKADPYAVMSQTLSETASVVHTMENFEWNDAKWLEHRLRIAQNGQKSGRFYRAPLNIYEMHLPSWRTRAGKSNKKGDAYLNYREIADLLVPYVKKLGYTHVELLPITEYPYDGSWGYQCCGYFAPTSRHGTPEDFKYFVDTLHKNGVGVIMDWVPAHFPRDGHGLFEFDGDYCYEYQGWDRRDHEEWGTRCFDVARNEVQCFLISSAMWWLGEYHIDGLRVDAVASMLYLDYARRPGEWVPNKYGTNHNLEAIAFFQKLNGTLFLNYSDILMIAEESTSWDKVTKPTSEGGLGFNFKWNMGWANDMYEYVATDPVYRKYSHDKLTFSLCYAFSENYIMPVSHDEVVHGKKSLIDKQFGSYEQKFAGMRAFCLWHMTHPGKKMSFMGCEYGQFREWDYENELEWFMLDYPSHSALLKFTQTLNNFYLENKELWDDDFSWGGFKWALADNRDENVVAFRRYAYSDDPNSTDEASELLVVINFSAGEQSSVFVPSESKSYEVVFSTDLCEFG